MGRGKEVSELKRLVGWGAGLSLITLSAIGVGILLMYQSGYRQQGEMLRDLAESQAAMIGAVARFDQSHSGETGETDPILGSGPAAATLQQVRSAFIGDRGLGKSGEMVLGTRIGDEIVILAHQREQQKHDVHRIPVTAKIGEPMRRALAGREGIITGLDIHGESVLAALQPIPELGWALVAKKDLSEIREPYLQAAGIAGMAGLYLVLLGGVMFRRATAPLINSLESNRRRYNRLIQTAGQGIILVDGENRITIANLKAKEIFGLPDDAEGRDLLEVMPPGMVEVLRGKLAERRHGKAEHYEVNVDVHGSCKYLGISATPFFSQKGDYEGSLALISDVTERRLTRDQLERERKLLRSVLNTLPVGVWAVDEEGRFFLHNPRGDELLQRTDYEGGRALFLEFKGWDLETGEQLTSEDWGMMRALDKGESVLGQVVDYEEPDGSRRLLRYSAVPLWGEGGDRLGALTVAEDITEERKTQQLLEQVLESLPVGVWVVDAEGQFIRHNPAGEKIWQGARYEGGQQVYGEYRGWWADTGEEIPPQEWAVARAVNQGETSLNEVIDIQCFDGSRKTILNSAVPLFDERGGIRGAIIVNEDISHRRSMEKLIQRNEQLLDRVLQNLPVGVAVTDDQGDYILANTSDTRIWGFNRLGKRASAFPGRVRREGDPDALIHSDWPVQRVLASGEPVEELILEITFSDGEERVLSCAAAPVFGGDNSLWGTVEFVQDITRSRRDQAQMRKLSDAVHHAADAIFIMDTEGHIQFSNPAFATITGFRMAEAMGRRPEELLHDGDAAGQRSADIWARVRGGEAIREVTTNRNKNGQLFQWELTLSPILGADGGVISVVGTATDLTREEHIREELHRATRFDALTGLSNRERLRDQLGQALAGTGYRPHITGLLKLDLERFAFINENMGHEAGDLVLREVARRLEDCVREGDLVARIGADSFAVMLTDVAREEDIPPVIQKLRDALAVPFDIRGDALPLSHSMGVALAPADGEDAETLMRHADVALTEARQEGGVVRFYAAGLGEQARRLLTLEVALRQALERDQLSLHFQPQVELAGGRLRGMEALMRWEHPELGPVSPGEFIPVAEKTGLISALSHWGLREALRQQVVWKQAGFAPGRMAVNLSAREFADPDLPDRVRRTLEEVGASPEDLELEITETVLMRESDLELASLKTLTEMGVAVSVDDFGTGYSSLAYLSVLPVESLKIDRAFISAVEDEQGSNAAIIRSVISMAQSLELEVVAEGVETDWQLQFLREAGCDVVQGFYLARPAAAEVITEMLRRDSWLP